MFSEKLNPTYRIISSKINYYNSNINISYNLLKNNRLTDRHRSGSFLARNDLLLNLNLTRNTLYNDLITW